MKNKVTESLITTLKRKVRPSQSASESEFLRRYYHRLSSQDYEVAEAMELRSMALHHRKLGLHKKRGEVIVELQNLRGGRGKNKGSRDKTIIYIVLDDMPFVINSLQMKLNALHKTPQRVLHPLFGVTRNSKNRATRIGKIYASGNKGNAGTGAGTCIESYIQFVINYTAEEEHPAIISNIRKILSDIGRVVEDWPQMRDCVNANAVSLEAMKKGPVFAEYGALFRWMTEDHFAFLGYCELEVTELARSRRVTVDKSSLLGVLKTADKEGVDLATRILPPIVFTGNAPIVFSKTRTRADIHRSSYMDCILFDQGFESGKKRRKVSCILGFLAGSTAGLPTSSIPHIRKKIAYVLDSSTLRESGHAYKELRTILETLPRDKLFHMDAKRVYSLGMTLLNQERRKTRLHLHRNVCSHFFSCLVYVPRDLFNSVLRSRIQAYLGKELHASEVEFNVYFSESILTRIHYIIHTDPDIEQEPNALELESAVQEIARDWNENLYEALKANLDDNSARDTMDLYYNAFAQTYQKDFSVEHAVADTQILSELQGNSIQARLSASMRTGGPCHASFKIYCTDIAIALSDVLPILENMGARIQSGRPYSIRRTDGAFYRLLDFEISRLDNEPFNFTHSSHQFETTFVRCWFGDIENDGYNNLTLLAGMSWRRINMIRAYYRYLKQIRLRYSENYIIEALAKNPLLVEAISSMFAARFDPRRKKTGIRKLGSEIKRRLDQVSTLDEERIIGALLDVISATRRTNYFQPKGDNSPKSYISFKLDSSTIPRIPEPAPLYEIFVYSPRVEGIHLRGGKVARGGLRWSERPEDYRTEVLGLVKAQRVKNAVIVPVGSKGGFVAKQLPQGKPEEVQKEVIACYRIFISSLLDLTDNLSGQRIIPPKNVVRMDEDDPYLVVAADKGTATFSDIANGISEDYGFWLGDAFASGGSAGYDHKKMGITARGAWESVKRHFRELGKDIQSESFTAVGIGDMAGDVFGNGMLLSKHTKLVAAFNHLHIFIDPDPDTKTSYEERLRLFNLPRSSWTDYNTKLISRGGGIYSRHDKSIKLSPQAKKALGAKRDAYAPTDLINVILKSEVELLWNGGIGTYVKASSESHSDAQDRNNDSLRVDATELRCKVIGEGGNLGMTQFSRIQFASRGGHCYTDAIDNSAGVDTSDHEVNIKVLLNSEVQKNRLTTRKRNSILMKMEKEVGILVLANNYQQTQVLSIEAERGSELMIQHIRAIEVLEESGLLSREIEFLPSHAELLERRENRKFLTRPELSVLLSYSKMDLYQNLLDSSLPDNGYLKTEIENYFPRLMKSSYLKQVHNHRLGREIISTQITNDMVGTMGTTFHIRLGDITGESADSICAAYIAARDILDNGTVNKTIQSLDNKITTATQMDVFNHLSSSLESTVVWILRNLPQPVDIGVLVKKYSTPLRSLYRDVEKFLSPSATTSFGRLKSTLHQAGISPSLSSDIATRVVLKNGIDIVDVSLNTSSTVLAAGEAYFRVSDVLGIGWIHHQISRLEVNNIWHERARFSLSSGLRNHQAEITGGILGAQPAGKPADAFASWEHKNSAIINSVAVKISSLKQEPVLDFSMLSVLVSELSLLR